MARRYGRAAARCFGRTRSLQPSWQKPPAPFSTKRQGRPFTYAADLIGISVLQDARGCTVHETATVALVCWIGGTWAASLRLLFLRERSYERRPLAQTRTQVRRAGSRVVRCAACAGIRQACAPTLRSPRRANISPFINQSEKSTSALRKGSLQRNRERRALWASIVSVSVSRVHNIIPRYSMRCRRMLRRRFHFCIFPYQLPQN